MLSHMEGVGAFITTHGCEKSTTGVFWLRLKFTEPHGVSIDMSITVRVTLSGHDHEPRAQITLRDSPTEVS